MRQKRKNGNSKICIVDKDELQRPKIICDQENLGKVALVFIKRNILNLRANDIGLSSPLKMKLYFSSHLNNDNHNDEIMSNFSAN